MKVIKAQIQSISNHWLVVVCCTLVFCISSDVWAGALTYTYDSLSRLTNAAYSDGSQESYSYDPAGNRLSRTTSTATVKVDIVPPTVPTNLMSLSFSPSQLVIAWSPASDTGGSGLAGYEVFVNGSLVGTTTDTNFLLSGLAPGTQYCLSLAAFDHSTNISAQSADVCFTTPVFDSPFLSPLGITNGQFQMAVTNGTVGAYQGLSSTNLLQWNVFTNLSLPAPGGVLLFPAPAQPQQFYQLRWIPNGGNTPQSP